MHDIRAPGPSARAAPDAFVLLRVSLNKNNTTESWCATQRLLLRLFLGFAGLGRFGQILYNRRVGERGRVT